MTSMILCLTSQAVLQQTPRWRISSSAATLFLDWVSRCMARNDDVTANAKITDAADPKTKAKPLRMKVPKSKERALIREFGLDATALTEEEAEKRRSELRALVKMGKTRGFLTDQAINDHLAEKLVDADVPEATVKMPNHMR